MICSFFSLAKRIQDLEKGDTQPSSTPKMISLTKKSDRPMNELRTSREGGAAPSRLLQSALQSTNTQHHQSNKRPTNSSQHHQNHNNKRTRQGHLLWRVVSLHNNNCIRTPNDAATYGTPNAASLPTGHAPHASDDGSYGDDGYDYVSAEHDGDDDADAAAAGSRPRTVSLIHVTARIG